MAEAKTAGVPRDVIQFAIDKELFEKLEVRGRVVIVAGPEKPGRPPFPYGIPADLRILAKLDQQALDKAGLRLMLVPKG